jgi:dihydroceramide fatty acyl 2-hydroxylase
MALLPPREWLTAECLDAAEGRGPRRTSIPIFRAAPVERWLARAHPILPIVWCGPLAALGLWSFASRGGGPGAGAALVAGGWLAFSLMEYLLHRFAFHRAFPHTPGGRLEGFLTHGYHHHYPNDRMRLVMPPLIAWPLALVVWGVYRVALGPGVSGALFAGTLLGYVIYDCTHYYAHHARPRAGVGRWLRRYHLLHHHDRQGGRFGVSSPLWDLVFGTFHPVDRAAPGPRPTPPGRPAEGEGLFRGGAVLARGLHAPARQACRRR